MKSGTLSRGRPTLSNPMDDTHETHKQLMQEGGATEGLADVLTENFKRLSDQSLQVNENLLSFREEVLDEFTGIHGEIKDIHHNAASNFQKLDAKIDSNHQSLDAKIDKIQVKLEADLASTNQEVKHTRETLSTQIDAKFAQVQNSMMRWNIGLFIGLAGLMVALIRPWE